MSPSSTPQLIFGAASFGSSFPETSDVQSVLDLLKLSDVKVLDTVGRYPPTSPGKSEELIGQIKAGEQGFTIDTKILATTSDGSGEISHENVQKSVEISLHRLKIPKIHTLHIHRPDSQTPVEHQIAALNSLYKEGKFTAPYWASQPRISNFFPDQLREFLSVCEKNGRIKPTTYQGDYSLVNRGMEKHLLPILREHGIVFNAFRALASGFLSGNLTSGSKEGTRFGGHGAVSQYMNKLYDNEPLHNAQRKLSKSIEGLRITAAEAALRWAMYHSALAGGDGIVLGASKESQIIDNIKSISAGPLPDSVVSTIEEVWIDSKAEKEDKYVY
ncbi:MAG: hypothetical protein MMC23_008705 [Stictis urceolatum]|nr:hypothetical protein [Stictis urceolata]